MNRLADVLGAIVAIVIACCLACSSVAKTQYGAQLDACIDQAKTKADADACLAKIRLEWDEAGSPPALVMVTDAGGQ